MVGLSALETRLAGYAILAIIATGWLIHHDYEIRVELEAQIAAQTKKANDALDAKVAAETQRDQGIADAAHKTATDTQAAVNAWVLAHPMPAVRLCGATNRQGSGQVPGAGQKGGGTGSLAPGSAAVPQVLAGDGGLGPDISGDLDAILSAATELGLVYQELAGSAPPASDLTHGGISEESPDSPPQEHPPRHVDIAESGAGDLGHFYVAATYGKHIADPHPVIGPD